MRDEDIHIGDVLRIRDWNDMASEFPVDRDSGIRMPGGIWFANGMKYLCGEAFTVASAGGYLEKLNYRSCENVEDDNEWGIWAITAEMLESNLSDTSEDEDFTPISTSDLMEFLKS